MAASRSLLYGFRREASLGIRLGGGAAAWVAIYAAGINRNVLYLAILGATYLIFSLFTRRCWSGLLVFGAFAYLACVPAAIPPAGFIEPVPHGPPDSPELSMLEPGEQWTYHFVLQDLGRYQTPEGLRGYLNIDGVDLADLRIQIQGQTLAHLPPPVIKYWREHLSIPVEGGDGAELVVRLSSRPGSHPRIFCGPEVHGFKIYSDAVWLEFLNEQTSVLYHAQRFRRP